jgi:hypothetical protein
LIGSFLEGMGFKAAVKVDTEFALDKEGAETGTGEVFTQGLLGFAKVKVGFLNAGS